MIVRQSRQPLTTYSRKIKIPPNRSQIILPIIFIKQKYNYKFKTLTPDIEIPVMEK